MATFLSDDAEEFDCLAEALDLIEKGNIYLAGITAIEADKLRYRRRSVIAQRLRLRLEDAASGTVQSA